MIESSNVETISDDSHMVDHDDSQQADSTFEASFIENTDQHGEEDEETFAEETHVHNEAMLSEDQDQSNILPESVPVDVRFSDPSNEVQHDQEPYPGSFYVFEQMEWRFVKNNYDGVMSLLQYPKEGL